jgi:phage terminase large subunit GpA-like protein
LNYEYESDDGVYRKILMMAVDAGYATQEVYSWVRSKPSTQVMAIKGTAKAIVPIGNPTKVDINQIPMYNPEYFKQLTAEQLVTRIHKGYPKSEWQKMRERNEALDCRIYARAAAIAIGIDRWSESRWNSLRPHAIDNPQQIPLHVIEKKRPRIVKSTWI